MTDILKARVTRREFIGGVLAGGALLAAGCGFEPEVLLTGRPGPSSRRAWAFSDSHVGLGGRANDGRDGAEWMELCLKDVRDNVGHVDYVLALGDVTDMGYEAQLARYADVRDRGLIGPWYELAGNHDYAAVPAGLWRKYVKRPPRYAVVDDSAAWIFLSAEQGKAEGRVSKASAQWLQKTIARHQERNVIVCSHQAVYNTVSGSGGGESYLEHRVLVERILREVRVDLWLCGHIHAGRRRPGYIARRDNTTFINVSSLGHAYSTGACTSMVLEMEQGQTTMQARCRNHESRIFVPNLSEEVPFPHPWRFWAEPKLVLLAPQELQYA